MPVSAFCQLIKTRMPESVIRQESMFGGQELQKQLDEERNKNRTLEDQPHSQHSINCLLSVVPA